MTSALALLEFLVGLTIRTVLGGAIDNPPLHLRQQSGAVSGPEVERLVSERQNTADYSGEASWRRESSDSRGGWRAGMQDRHPTCGDRQPFNLPNPEEVFRGYNIYKGTPLSPDGYDPGFLGNSIFKVTYSHNATTGDCAYSVPDGLQLVLQVVCNFNFARLHLWEVSVTTFVSLALLSTAFIAHYDAPKFYVQMRDRFSRQYTRAVILACDRLCHLHLDHGGWLLEL